MNACEADVLYFFFGLVIIARAKHPIPSRTRQLSAAALMVLRLKAWESKSLPNLIRSTGYLSIDAPHIYSLRCSFGAGWSSPVARQAHNLKVVGSNPTPATKINITYQYVNGHRRAAFCFGEMRGATAHSTGQLPAHRTPAAGSP